MPTIEIPIWPYAYGQPVSTGNLRTLPEDFIVTEQLAFEPSGDGEHVFLYIEKIGENTEYIARLLARHAQVRQRDIGYAGLKDRHAITRQWFSVWLPGKTGDGPDWTLLNGDQLHVLHTVRHAQKLKRGVLAGNQFQITLRNWQGDTDTLIRQLEQIKTHGVPNYYGGQRFGHNGQNVNKALAMFDGAKTGREQRSLYLSAARSFLFNQLLAQRVQNQTWNQAVDGDAYIFDRSNSCFKSTQADDGIIRRLSRGDIHPSGMLWGKGDADVSSTALQLEHNIIAAYPALAEGLLAVGVDRNRRALRANVFDLQWAFITDDVLVVSFSLPAGSYATAALREFVDYGEK
ncbi:MAG: tRNA pseudouridine(13) synthase TruD [Methylovulum sp.]|uniref:tRNA pseudouridine(13) synthase TruD n=1 Tax=Methylovulum sp. TaxID=1916980 RepID=UPI002634AFFB|nr:tRNA pseudouridine(13) synthase TruD [Methylovulum sp.]MDD2723018.1 tRNA pseudouridine(13) synthase TruD [Methylovulum sp.]MDD5125228.1 tRNA pseudouridine(13) synthase TruD [Methylovulum sp.]